MRVRLLAGLVAAFLAAGCSTLPASGPVHHEPGRGEVDAADAAVFAPPPPGPGDTQAQVVNGFLLAMTSVPLSMSVPRSFLADEARRDWAPDRATVVYQTATLVPRPDGLRVRLEGAQELDARGGWLGPVRDGVVTYDLRLVRDGGEWRIANPPDVVLVPQWYLVSQYEPLEVYFFDPTGEVLVPDRIYVPRGTQRASTLIRALLAGPGRDLRAVTRTEIPAQTQLDLSVLVSPGGVADVPLSRDVLGLAAPRLDRVIAQVATTLRQVPGITRVRLTAGGNPLPLPDGSRDFSVRAGSAFAATVPGASRRVFGLRKSRVVSLRGGREVAVPGPLGGPGYALRSVAVSLGQRQVAAVARDGRSVFVSTRGGAVRRVYTGTDVERPAYDMFGAAWLLDDTATGARVLRVTEGEARPVVVPGVSGERVSAFLVSRDGTRLVAAIRGGSAGSRVVTAVLVRTRAGAVRQVDRATRLESVAQDVGRIVDLAWHSPNDLVVLGRTSGISQVDFAALDGSPGDPEEVPPDFLRGAVSTLVGSPDPTLPLYARTGAGQVLRLDADGHWVASTIAKGLLSPTYVG